MRPLTASCPLSSPSAVHNLQCWQLAILLSKLQSSPAPVQFWVNNRMATFSWGHTTLILTATLICGSGEQSTQVNDAHVASGNVWHYVACIDPEYYGCKYFYTSPCLSRQPLFMSVFIWYNYRKVKHVEHRVGCGCVWCKMCTARAGQQSAQSPSECTQTRGDNRSRSGHGHQVRPHHEEGGQEEPPAGRGRLPQAGLHPGGELGQGEAAGPRG